MADESANSDLSNEPFWSQFKSFGYIYWVANWMELVERFAYYGVRVVLPVFMVLAVEEGGPELTQIQKGSIYAVWAVVQSFIPILSGGFADRYGYKLNIALSTVLKIIGYVIMGYSVRLSEFVAGMPLREARDLGVDHVYGIFFAGAMFLAFGTAIFKPGVQGLIANQMPPGAASLGWGLFYQMVNIGGFIGPLVAGYLRVLEWEYVFLVCAAGITLNFIPLFCFKEPSRPEISDSETTNPLSMLYEAVHGLLEPRLFFFTISFAGFWLMFYQLFDILPNFIDDWIDSRSIATSLSNLTAAFGDGLVPVGKDANQGNLTQEWMINFNALLISLFAFLIAFLTGKMRSLTSIIIGIGLSAVAIYGLGMSMTGWWILGAIGLFSVGEMMASPTKMRYLASIAPPGKEGLFMGYANFTVGIGWSIGSIIAGHMYEENGDKVNLARKYLVDNAGVAADTVKELKKNEVLSFFENKMGLDAWKTRELLWDTYEPQSMWLTFAMIGVGAMFAIIAYNFVIKAADANPQHSFNTHGVIWVRSFLIPICFLILGASIVEASTTDPLTFHAFNKVISVYLPSPGLALNTMFFWLMLIVSFKGAPKQEQDPIQTGESESENGTGLSGDELAGD